MPVNVVVKFDIVGAEKIDKAERSVDDVATAATKATTALKGMGEGAAAGMGKASTELEAYRRKLDEQWAAINQKKFDDENIKRINGPMDELKKQLESVERLYKESQISAENYYKAIAKAQQQAEAAGALGGVQGPVYDPGRAGVAPGVALGPAFDSNQAGRGMTEELRRQEELLRRLNAPMQEYEQRLRDLDALLRRDAIDQEIFNRELDKAAKSAGRGLGPVQGPKPPGMAGPGGGGGAGGGDLLQAVAPQLGQGGQILSQFASGGVAAAAGAAAFAFAIVRLGDEYTTLANKVERFATSTQSTSDILRQQLDLSRDLHASLAATEQLYVRVRESTTELNLSSRQQLQLARDIGVDVAAEGRSVEEAAALMRRLSLAMESGAISGRELRSIFKEFPTIGDGLSATFGKTRNELLQMANKGQVSAQQIIDAFHKMAPEAEKTLSRMDETTSQSLEHIWDSIKITYGRLRENPFEEIRRNAERARHELADNARQLAADLEKNAKTAQISGAAGNLGIALPGFDQAAADSITRMRMTARAAGIDIADAFADAKIKAQLYGAEIDKIREAHAAKEIAEDAQRIHDALYGAENVVKDSLKHWTDIADKAVVIAEAIKHWRVLDAGGPTSREAIELERQRRDLQTSLDTKPFGDDVGKYRQGLDKARDGLNDWRAAAKAGTISGEELRKKTDEFLTTLNDGRLPEAIKIMEGIHLPIEQAGRDFAALSALWKQGRLDVEQYTAELNKIAATHLSGAAAILAENIAVLDKRLADGVYDLRAHDDAVRKLTASYAELHRTASGITYRVAPIAQAGRGGLLPNVEQRGYAPSVGSGDEMRKILAQTQSATLVPLTSDNAALINQQLERAHQLALEFVAPAVKYEEALKDITVAQETWGNTEEQSSILRRRARVEYENAEEALAKLKGPQEAYDAALKHLNDQLGRAEISQSKYTDAVRKAREQLITDTGGDKTFLGALELQWIKLQQEADKLGATIAGQLLGDVDKFNDALVQAANGGQVSFSAMADAMIQDLERVALKMLEMKAIGALFSAFSGGGGGGGGLADTGIGAENWMGYANGGSFLVGGSGPPDSKLFNPRLSPGEAVSVRTPGQQSDARARQSAAPAPVVFQLHNHNHYDSSVAQATIDGPGGQKSVINTLRLNPGAARNMTSRPRRA